MSHRKRCMGGVFSKILRHLGLVKDPPLPASASASASPQPPLPSPSSSSNNHNIPPVASHPKAEPYRAAPPAVERKAPDRPPARAGSFKKRFMNKDALPAEKASNAKPSTGFRVRVSVPVNKEPSGPVVVECTSGSGGVQGLQWYSEKLMMDEDGDVAQEFLDEVMSQASGPLPGYPRILPRFKPKMKTMPAQLEGPVCTCDGNIVQTVGPPAFVKCG